MLTALSPSVAADAGAPSRRCRNRFSPLALAGGRALARWAAAAAIAVLTPGFSPAAEGAGGLFAAAGPVAGRATLPADDAVLRRRLVTIDTGMLERARSSAVARRAESAPLAAGTLDRAPTSTAGWAAPATLVLNLFEDAAFQAIIESEAPTFSGGYSLSGRLAGEPFGSVTLVVNGAIVAGTVRTLRGTYSVETTAGGLYAVSEVDPPELVEHHDMLEPPADRPEEGSQPHRH